MTGYQREVPGLSRNDIAVRAALLRQQWSLVHGTTPDAFPVTEYIETLLMKLREDFVLEIVEDHEMNGLEGATWPDDLKMRFGNSVYEDAARGSPRPRFTVAHELGHLFLHRGIPFARVVLTGKKIDPFRCSEWQADEFAGALLMPIDLIASMRSVREIMERCGVSQKAAETRISKLKITKPRGW